MRRVFKRKTAKPRKLPAPLKKAYEELDKTARTLIQTDLKLHQANERFNQQIVQLRALHRLGTVINSTFDIEEILKTVAELMAKDLDFEKSGVVFLDPKGQKPMQSSYLGFTASEYAHFLEHFDALIHPLLRSEEEVSLQTISHAPEPSAKLMRTLGISSLVLLPMRFKNRMIGFIAAGRTHVMVRLSDAERRFYGMYAAQVSAAVENARLYEALGQANLSLEEKVHDRTRSLIEANERLRGLDTAKSNFISMISHELRTPLTAIKGFVTMLHKHDLDISDEKRRIYLNVLNEETDRLTRLITELLDISRIESGKIEFKWEKVSVLEKVKEVFDTLALPAKKTTLTYDFSEDFPVVVADGDKLEQVLLNLVMNAMRFSPSGGQIVVRGRPARDGVALEVADQGMGIPFNEQEKIFEKFYRLDNEINRKTPGTGLGLSICRALVNLHGGKIWAESDPGQGSRFLISLPLNHDKLTGSEWAQGTPMSPPPGYREVI
jgi:two-component system, sensor histidine kinase and response regulator